MPLHYHNQNHYSNEKDRIELDGFQLIEHSKIIVIQALGKKAASYSPTNAP